MIIKMNTVILYGYNVFHRPPPTGLNYAMFAIAILASFTWPLPLTLGMDLNTFRKGIRDEFFQPSAAFQKNIMYVPLSIDDSSDLQDSMTLRALMVFMHYGHYGMLTWSCSRCKASCTLRRRDERQQSSLGH